MKVMLDDGAFNNVKCPICGKEFHLKPSKLAIDKNHYCSRECHREAKREYMKGERNHQYGLRGDKNASWKGGKKLSHYGYYLIYAPDHPFAQKDNHCVLEHRLIAEKYFLTDENSIDVNGKKYLKPEYEVHHIDFDRTNNNPENLVVLTHAEHKAIHNKLNPNKRDETNGRFVKREKKVFFKKVVETAIIPESATDDSAGYDMYAELKEPITIQPHKAEMIRSGIALSIPKGYAGFVFARSGLATKHGLRPTTCVSVIDADYRGEVGLPVRNDSDEPKIINPHDRIAQMVFMPVLKPKIEIVESLDMDTERGENGFGSTGK